MNYDEWGRVRNKLELILGITWIIVGAAGYVVAYYHPEQRFSANWTGTMLLLLGILNLLSWSKSR